MTLLIVDWGKVKGMEQLDNPATDTDKYVAIFPKSSGASIRTIKFDNDLRKYVIELPEQARVLPDDLCELPLLGIVMRDAQIPLTKAEAGRYNDPEKNIVATVMTYSLYENVRQSITVLGGAETSLKEINDWFDSLITGQKKRFLIGPDTDF